MAGDKDVEAGQFAEIPEDFELPRRNSPREEPQIYLSEELIAIYTAFREQVHNPQSVLYPSCGFDASPARIFDNVTFVDIEDGNERCVAKLQEAGLQALKQDIRTYRPQELHDLLILLNPAIPTEWASRHLQPGGYVISNNYHGNASEMHRQPDQFTLWGVINFAEKDRRKGDNQVVVSRNVEDLFQPVANEEELQRFRPEYYDFLQMLFPSFALNMPDFSAEGPFEEVWANYREMMREGMPSKRVADRYIFVKK